MTLKKLIPYLLTFVIIMMMIECSILLQNPEIILPEAAILTIGALLAPRRIWQTSFIKSVGLIIIYSILGIVMVKFVDVPFYMKIVATFFMCYMGMLMSHTNFTPLIAACFYPIIMDIESWNYSLLISLIALIVAVVQIFLQENHYQKYEPYRPIEVHIKKDVWLFIKRMLVIILVSGIATYFQLSLIIVPPLLMAFMDLSSTRTVFKKKNPSIFFITVLMSFLSAYSRYYLINKYQMSSFFVMIAIVLLLLILIALTKTYFPALGSFILLPFVIDLEYLLMYPIIISVSLFSFMLFAFIVSPHQKKSLSTR